MHEIHPHQLWIGHALDLREPRALFDSGIAAVIDLAFEELPAQLPRQLIYCRFPIIDGGGNEEAILFHALQTIIDLIGTGTRTIVGCSAGMSRSPTLASFALAAHLGEEPNDVVKRHLVRKSNTIIMPKLDKTQTTSHFRSSRPGSKYPAQNDQDNQLPMMTTTNNQVAVM